MKSAAILIALIMRPLAKPGWVLNPWNVTDHRVGGEGLGLQLPQRFAVHRVGAVGSEARRRRSTWFPGRSPRPA